MELFVWILYRVTTTQHFEILNKNEIAKQIHQTEETIQNSTQCIEWITARVNNSNSTEMEAISLLSTTEFWNQLCKFKQQKVTPTVRTSTGHVGNGGVSAAFSHGRSTEELLFAWKESLFLLVPQSIRHRQNRIVGRKVRPHHELFFFSQPPSRGVFLRLLWDDEAEKKPSSCRWGEEMYWCKDEVQILFHAYAARAEDWVNSSDPAASRALDHDPTRHCLERRIITGFFNLFLHYADHDRIRCSFVVQFGVRKGNRNGAG